MSGWEKNRRMSQKPEEWRHGVFFHQLNYFSWLWDKTFLRENCNHSFSTVRSASNLETPQSLRLVVTEPHVHCSPKNWFYTMLTFHRFIIAISAPSNIEGQKGQTVLIPRGSKLLIRTSHKTTTTLTIEYKTIKAWLSWSHTLTAKNAIKLITNVWQQMVWGWQVIFGRYMCIRVSVCSCVCKKQNCWFQIKCYL